VLVISILFSVAALIFIDPLLRLLGTTENIWNHSYDYTSIILIGQPFIILSTALSSVIRADGSPRYSMTCMLVGAIMNTILDPIFIFVFDMGVAGAAIATVISQIASFLVSILYFNRRAKNVLLKRVYMRPHAKVVRAVMSLGFSSFVTQVTVTVLNVVLNNLLRHYGDLSVYGSEIPLSATGIIQKVNGILISVLIGIAVGAQPILGYNYGAQHYKRVKQTYMRSVLIATIIAAGSWMLFLLFPEGIIASFGDNSPEFVDFGAIAFRLYLGAVCTAGFQIVSSQYFQATGRPGKSAFLSMTRQLIFLIPMMLVLSYIFGLMGVLYAGIAADVSAFTVTLCFIIMEMRKLNKQIMVSA
jgi:putative MATE family efflux protein